MKVTDLLRIYRTSARFVSLGQVAETEVQSLTADARTVTAGSIFVAIRGTRFDAHQELPAVAARGAVGLVVEDRAAIPKDYHGAVVEVPDSRKALARLASHFYQEPSLHMFCFGVTGTNGKTSCTYLMEHLLDSLNMATGVIGTVEHRLGQRKWPTEATTPGPIELQSRLNEMRHAGARALAIEVSSHALDQSRVDGMHFNALLFTNLTRDHLDYHGSFEAYFAAKQRLFTDFIWETRKRPVVAAVNIDDPWGRRLRVASPAEIISYGRHREADFRFEPISIGFSSTRFRLHTNLETLEAEIPLCGSHNIANVVGCVAAATALGVAPALSLKSLESFQGVPGRLQHVENSRGLNVFVDYAHSPDALENVLRTLTQVRSGSKSAKIARLWTVFGCGGDRDKGKRPQMARIAEKYSDEIIVTNDNPRTEDPAQIAREIQAGFAAAQKARVILDRREAIATALRQARAGDIVLIAGKGHEDYQILGTEKIAFSDVDVAREVLR